MQAKTSVMISSNSHCKLVLAELDDCCQKIIVCHLGCMHHTAMGNRGQIFKFSSCLADLLCYNGLLVGLPAVVLLAVVLK